MTRALATLAAALSFVLALISLVLVVSSPELPIVSDKWGFRGYDAAFAVAFGAVGIIVAWHRPENAIGWLYLAVALLSGAQTITAEYAAVAPLRGWDLAWATRAELVNEMIWIPIIALVSASLVLFPTGRPASRRWRVLLGVLGVTSPAITFLWGAAPPGTGGPSLLPTAPPDWLAQVTIASLLLLSAQLFAGFVALASRMRTSRGVERLQLKWLAYAAAFVAAALLLNFVAFPAGRGFAKAAEVATILAMMLLPVSVGIAILRHRLYDIDLLINRTLVYGATSALLALVYAGAVLALGSVARPLTGSGDLAVAGSTLAVVALFAPLRRRVQGAVDKRFYRQRYDAQRAVDRFALRLRDEVELEAVRAGLLGAVTDTVRPAHARLWVREVER